MKQMKYLSVLFAALVASGCGGGDALDAATFSVLPNGFTHLTTCPGGAVVDALSVHTINGGREPFRLRGAEGLEVGTINAAGQFVPGTKIGADDLVLEGRDPEFAIRATLGCSSDVPVLVLDDTSATVSVSIKVAAGE